jgi:hypothetical protein
VFEDPVTESIAPGYHEQISMPMDYSTVESRLEKRHYSTREEVHAYLQWNSSNPDSIALFTCMPMGGRV